MQYKVIQLCRIDIQKHFSKPNYRAEKMAEERALEEQRLEKESKTTVGAVKQLIQKVSSLAISDNIISNSKQITPRKMRSSRNVHRDKSPGFNAAYYESEMKQINTHRQGTYRSNSFYNIDTRKPSADYAIKGGDSEMLQNNLDQDHSLLANKQNSTFTLKKSHSRDDMHVEEDGEIIVTRTRDNLTVESSDDQRKYRSRKSSLPLSANLRQLSRPKGRGSSRVQVFNEKNAKDTVIPEDNLEDAQSPIKRKIKFTANNVNDKSKFSKTDPSFKEEQSLYGFLKMQCNNEHQKSIETEPYAESHGADKSEHAKKNVSSPDNDELHDAKQETDATPPQISQTAKIENPVDDPQKFVAKGNS